MSNEMKDWLRDNICTCRVFKNAQMACTDNEGYGRLVYVDGRGWKIGYELPPIKYCPWCGLELPDAKEAR